MPYFAQVIGCSIDLANPFFFCRFTINKVSTTTHFCLADLILQNRQPAGWYGISSGYSVSVKYFNHNDQLRLAQYCIDLSINQQLLLLINSLLSNLDDDIHYVQCASVKNPAIHKGI